MKRFVLFGALVCVALRLSAAAPAPYRLASSDASGLPKIHVVLDARGKAGGTLSAGDFRLLEDGKAGAVGAATIPFRDSGLGMAVVVAIDVSPSMSGAPLNAIRQGLGQLVSRKREKDRITVMSFANDIRWETRWDATSGTVRDALQRIAVRGNRTRLYDAVGAALDEFRAQSGEDPSFPRRQCIVVLSDGHDEGSTATLSGMLDRLAANRIRLDAVGLAHSPFWLRSLAAMADAGFGAFQTARTPEQLSGLLGRGIDNLLDLPVLTFENSSLPRDGKEHRVGVEDLPSHWRQDVALTVPPSDRTWTFVALVAGALVFLAGVVWLTRSRKPGKPAAIAFASAAPAAAPPRTPTAFEAPPAPIMTRRENPMPDEPAIPPKTTGPPARRGTVFAQPMGSNFVLAVTGGPHAGQRIPVLETEFWIGSAVNNHLRLGSDQSVSGNHAAIRQEKGFYRLFDNGSLNDTFVNGRRIGREAVLLSPGDRIQLGQSEVTFEIGA